MGWWGSTYKIFETTTIVTQLFLYTQEMTIWQSPASEFDHICFSNISTLSIWISVSSQGSSWSCGTAQLISPFNKGNGFAEEILEVLGLPTFQVLQLQFFFFTKVPTYKASTRNTRNIIKNPKTAAYFDQTLQSFSFLKQLMRYEFIIKKSCSCLYVLSKNWEVFKYLLSSLSSLFPNTYRKTAEKNGSSKWLDAGAWTAWLKCLAASAWRLSSAMADKQPLCGWFFLKNAVKHWHLGLFLKVFFFENIWWVLFMVL